MTGRIIEVSREYVSIAISAALQCRKPPRIKEIDHAGFSSNQRQYQAAEK